MAPYGLRDGTLWRHAPDPLATDGRASWPSSTEGLRERGVSRSHLVRDLLEAALAEDAAIERVLIDGYRAHPQSDARDAWGDLDEWTRANARRNLAALTEGGRWVVARGEVWWSEDEVLGRRPVLVLTRDAVLGVLRRPLVAPLTTRVRGLPTEVALDADDGLSQTCVVSLDNVQPLAVVLLTERITQLGPAKMQAVCKALALATAC